MAGGQEPKRVCPRLPTNDRRIGANECGRSEGAIGDGDEVGGLGPIHRRIGNQESIVFVASTQLADEFNQGQCQIHVTSPVWNRYDHNLLGRDGNDLGGRFGQHFGRLSVIEKGES